MGYLPGTLWILAGVVFAGAVQDFMVLFISTRRDGRSLGDMIKSELGTVPGLIALFGVLMIMIIILAVLALVVVKALAESPWGTFTVIATIPIAMFMGIYLRFIRPGRVLEMSIIGFVLLMLGIIYRRGRRRQPDLGPDVHDVRADAGAAAHRLRLRRLGAAGVAAAGAARLSLHVPQDRHHRRLAVGILIVRPDLQMPALTKFIDGSGPVFSGALFPFLFITIACGAVSGFHALISSGTTPKMLENETQARFIGYGGMLMESFVAIMALIAACVLDPGVYFAMNSPAGADRHDARAGGASDFVVGLRRHPGRADADGEGRRRAQRSCRAPAARRRSLSAWPTSSQASSAAKR